MSSIPVEDQDVVQGTLGLGTLPALIRRIHEERRSGTLHLRSNGYGRRVHFQWGEVIFAGSDLTHDRLDRRLREEGTVQESQLTEARAAQESSGKRFGESLIELGVMTEEELLAAVEQQVRSIVTVLFSLDRGEYRFEDTNDPVEQDLVLDLPMKEIIVDGIRSMSDPVALQIGVGAMTDFLHRGAGSSSANVDAAEAFVLSRVDGRTSVLDILAVSPLSDVETLRSICALLAVGTVEAKPEPLPNERAAEDAPVARPPEREPESELDEPTSVGTTKELSEDDKRASAARRYEEGKRLYGGRRFHEAIGALLEAVRLDGEQAHYHRLLGHAYARNPKWHGSAIEHLEEAVRLDDTDVKAHYLLGEMYEQSERPNDAKAAFARVLALEPKHERAQRKLGGSGLVTRLKSIFSRSSAG